MADSGLIDTSNTYIFTSRQTGGLVLAVSDQARNGSPGPGLTMLNTTASDASGQWFLTRVGGNQPGIFYRVHVAALGVGQSLDVVNEGGAVNSTRLTMSPSDNNSGQAWRFDRWSDKDSDGYRLSNKFTGPDMHLDVETGTLQARLFGGDFSGQHWTLNSAGGSPEPDGGDGSDGSGGGHLLSTEGIIGLSVVAALGLGLGFFGLLFWLWKSRSRRRRQQQQQRLWGAPTAELSTEAAAAAYFQMQRKASMQSFHSAQSYGMQQLQLQQTPPVVPAGQDPEVAAVSPESTYRKGSFAVASHDTGLSGKTASVDPVEPVELPDKAYE